MAPLSEAPIFFIDDQKLFSRRITDFCIGRRRAAARSNDLAAYGFTAFSSIEGIITWARSVITLVAGGATALLATIVAPVACKC